MMRLPSYLIILCGAWSVLTGFAADQSDVEIEKTRRRGPGNELPILVSASGISGEALQVLEFDLYVQGFAFTNAEAAQYLISGSNNGSLQARVTDKLQKQTLVSKAYSGASIRRQAHAFADDFVQALGRKPICQTKIAFKNDSGPTSEIYIADFDGHNEQAVTKDNNIVAAPSWAQLIMRRCPARFPDEPPTRTGLVTGEKTRRGHPSQ